MTTSPLFFSNTKSLLVSTNNNLYPSSIENNKNVKIKSNNMDIISTSSSTNKSESPLVKFVISGAVAWGYEFMLGHYLEYVKIVKQTQPEKSYLQLTRNMIAQKGIAGVLDGFFPWGTVQAISKGAVFGFAHAAARKSLEPLVQKKTLSHSAAEVISGGIGGGFQGLVLSPLLLLKTRVMTDPVFRQKMGMWETTKRSSLVGMSVIRNEGVMALMKGSIMFSGKRVADWSTRYLFAEGIESLMSKSHTRKLSTTEKLAASFLGGTLSTLATIPMDVMVAQIQQASKAGQKVSAIEAFRYQLKQGGISGVLKFSTRGLIARIAHVSLTTALMKTGSTYVYDLWVKVAK
jgi:hypothetical protein